MISRRSSAAAALVVLGRVAVPTYWLAPAGALAGAGGLLAGGR